MSWTFKQLNGDASFLLTFEPTLSTPSSLRVPQPAFTIVLDPWLSGPSNVLHPRFSTVSQKSHSCISSLRELPEPDLVIVSQRKTDHCNRSTLQQLPRRMGKTVILAEAGAAKTIKNWTYFDQGKVVTLHQYNKSDVSKTTAVRRFPVPSLAPGGFAGEVTISLMTQRSDLTGLHTAVGITYRPPSLGLSDSTEPSNTPQTSTRTRTIAEPVLSVIFSAHGCGYKSIQPWIRSHLVQEGALPLTALLHCFDHISNPWYLGGTNISAGLRGGAEIAQATCAKKWISCHDGEKVVKGFATTMLNTRKFDRDDVQNILSPLWKDLSLSRTEVINLGVGEETKSARAKVESQPGIR